MDPVSPGYMTYLLRLWNAGGGQEPVWRVTLENPRTGERHVFLDLKTLLVFLEEETCSALAVDPEPDALRGRSAGPAPAEHDGPS